MMFRVPALIAVLGFGMLSYATTYYVATNGSDAAPNTGTLAAPYLTIQKAATAMRAGDTCVTRAGTYRETVRPAQSGTSGSLMTFKNYPGEHVVVSGADLFSPAWSVHSGSIYKATTALNFVQLFVGGVMMNEARWPNAKVDSLVNMPRARAKAGTNTTTLVDASLPAGTWNGARVLITVGSEWVSGYSRVSNYQAGNRFTLNPSITGETWQTPAEGNPYYLSGVLAALDISTEWLLASGTVYLWTPNGASPATHVVEVKQRDYAFDLSGRSYIRVYGIDIFGAAVLMTTAQSVTIDSCHVLYAAHSNGDEVERYNTPEAKTNIVTGSNNEWKNSTVAYSALSAISLGGTNNKVTNCIMHDVNYHACNFGVITASGSGHAITRNTLYNSGRFIISYYNTQAARVDSNNLYNAGYLTDDCGITYAFGTNANGTIIAYNWVHDIPGQGAKFIPINAWTWGLYQDDNTSGVIAHHNVIWNYTLCGLASKGANEFYNNTLLDNSNDACFSGTEIAYNNLATAFNYNGATNANNADPAVCKIGADYVPIAGSCAINAGRVVAPYTNGFSGSAPDIGAYESGATRWQPGATITEPARSSPPTSLSPRSDKASLQGVGSVTAFAQVGSELWYSIPKSMRVEVRMFDMAGSVVATLVNQEQAGGSYRVDMQTALRNRRPLAPGFYLSSLCGDGVTLGTRTILVR